MPTIADTRFQMVQLVFPEHTNQRGTLYGGRMMSWIATAGTLAASRAARGAVVLGAMDDLDFLTPIHLGEIVTMDAQVESIGRSSLEVGVTVHAELPQRGVPRRATSSISHSFRWTSTSAQGRWDARSRPDPRRRRRCGRRPKAAKRRGWRGFVHTARAKMRSRTCGRGTRWRCRAWCVPKTPSAGR